MKYKRQAALLKIIKDNQLRTHEQLIKKLKESGFNVTQATVSRDIKDLRLTKIPDERGGYKYTSVDRADAGITPKMKQLFINTVLSINSANNIIVVKTLAGSASTIGVVVDALKHPAILGSVAGDDTMIIVVSSNNEVSDVVNKLNLMLE